MLLHNALGEEAVVGQEAWGVDILLVVTVLGLDGVTGQQHRGLGWAINFIGQNGVLDLERQTCVFVLFIYYQIYYVSNTCLDIHDCERSDKR